jgi:hypothetical protein
MNEKTRWISNNGFLKGGLLCILLMFLCAGCASTPGKFDPNIKGPQMFAEPMTVCLAVSTVTGTPMVFKGKGFQPGDSVFVELLGVQKAGKEVKVPIADADVAANGEFVAKVSTLVKVTELLRAKLGSNKEMETTIIVTQPTIPPGVYVAQAVSMDSDITAKCKWNLEPPSCWGKFKDWMGGLMGKIIKK